jgi:hypothetical protein
MVPCELVLCDFVLLRILTLAAGNPHFAELLAEYGEGFRGLFEDHLVAGDELAPEFSS